MAVEGPKRVLVVGDNHDIGNVLGELLTRYGYAVQCTGHSTAPYVLVAEPEGTPPDVAILDANRPVSRCVSVLEFIRGAMHSRLPVIVLTADATEEHEAEYQRLGVDRLLWKPARASELLEAVAEAAG